MSKNKDKKKKKNKNKQVFAYIYKNDKDDKEKKTKKKNKKYKYKNKDAYKKPVKKTVTESLSKKKIKKAASIVGKKPKISEKLIEIQNNCNHAGVVIGIPEYKSLSVMPGVYTPRLDLIEQVFGDNKTCVCASCYQVLVDPSVISVDKAREAIAMLHAVVTAILPRKKMKEQEIEKFNTLIDSLNEWDEAVSTFETMANNGYFINDDSDVASTIGANLNNMSNASYDSYAYKMKVE